MAPQYFFYVCASLIVTGAVITGVAKDINTRRLGIILLALGIVAITLLAIWFAIAWQNFTL